MNYQFFTDMHDNAPKMNSVENYFQLLKDVLQNGVFCYTVDQINGSEIIINNGANVCEKTEYTVSDGVNEVITYLKSTNLNTIVARESLSSLNQQNTITIRTATKYDWKVDDIDGGIRIYNNYGYMEIKNNGTSLERKGGRGNLSSDVSTTTISYTTRYKILFNENIICVFRDNRLGAGAILFLDINADRVIFNGASGSSELIKDAALYIIDESSEISGLQGPLVSTSFIPTTVSPKKNIFSNIYAGGHVVANIFYTVAPFGVEHNIFGCDFLYSDGFEFIVVPNNSMNYHTIIGFMR